MTSLSETFATLWTPVNADRLLGLGQDAADGELAAVPVCDRLLLALLGNTAPRHDRLSHEQDDEQESHRSHKQIEGRIWQ